MNLYKLSQSDRIDYDTYDSCVVASESEDEARKIHPGDYPLEEDGRWVSRPWAKKPENVTVELIGIATPGTEEGVICASFNAG